MIPFLLVLGCLQAPSSVDESAWTRFRGPNGSGVAKAELPTALTEENILWRVKLPGPGHSSPVLWQKRLYVTCQLDAGSRALVCVDAETGKSSWTRSMPFEPHGQHRLNSFASSTPACDAQGVYILWTDGPDLKALSMTHEGEVRWSQTLGPHRANHGSGASPILVGDVMVVANDNEGDESFVCGLDKESGDVLWRRERETSRAAFMTPISRVREDGQREVLFTSTSHGLSAFDPESGDTLWEYDPAFDQRCVGSPALSGAFLFMSAGSGGGGKQGALLELPEREGQQPKKCTFQPRRSLPYVPTGLGHEDSLFLWADNGIVTHIDLSEGKVLWQERTSGQFYASPVWAGGHLYNISLEGVLFVVGTGDSFDIVSTLEIGERSQATMAIALDRLFVRTENELLAIGGRHGS